MYFLYFSIARSKWVESCQVDKHGLYHIRHILIAVYNLMIRTRHEPTHQDSVVIINLSYTCITLLCIWKSTFIRKWMHSKLLKTQTNMQWQYIFVACRFVWNVIPFSMENIALIHRDIISFRKTKLHQTTENQIIAFCETNRLFMAISYSS
jgi:hypothetical protein